MEKCECHRVKKDQLESKRERNDQMKKKWVLKLLVPVKKKKKKTHNEIDR